MITRTQAEDAAFVFGFDLSCPLTKEQINAMYKSLAMKAHPDGGGSPEAFVRVDRAKHILLKWLDKPEEQRQPRHEPRPCGNCAGKGYIQTMQGFKMGPRKQCQPCRGTGDADFEPEEGEAF